MKRRVKLKDMPEKAMGHSADSDEEEEGPDIRIREMGIDDLAQVFHQIGRAHV